LDVAASYWQWWGLWGWHGQRRQSQTVREQGRAAGAGDASAEDAEELRTYGMVRYQAYRFITPIDGGGQFCREGHVEPGALLDCKPGRDRVTRTEARAREQAFQPEDAAMFLLSETSLPAGGAEANTLPVLTVQSLAFLSVRPSERIDIVTAGPLRAVALATRGEL
jgi:hypothetical protein